MAKYFCSIISCNKNFKNIQYLEKNLCSSLDANNVNNFIFVGTSEENITNKRIVKLNVCDDYFSLRYKVLQALEYSLSYDYDYFIKIDDDTFFDFSNIDMLSFKDYDYIGNFLSYKNLLKIQSHHIEYLKSKKINSRIPQEYFNNEISEFSYAAGGFYILSKSTVIKILNKLKQFNSEPCIKQEDAFIGYLCSLCSLKILDISDNLDFYDVSKYEIFCHPVNTFVNKKLLLSNNRRETLKKYTIFSKYYKPKLKIPNAIV